MTWWTFGRRSVPWLGVAAALLLADAASANAPAQGALQDQVNRLVDLGNEAPESSFASLNALAAKARPAPELQRIVEAGIGLVAGDHGMKAEAARAVAALEGLAGRTGGLAHADALLVQADLEIRAGDSKRSVGDIVAAVAAYAPYCDPAVAADTRRCNPYDWFYANMFAGVALSDGEARATSALYLQTARDIAQRARRPDLEARATAFAAQMAQAEKDIGLGDRLLQRANALAQRSQDASAQEFVKMFEGYVLQDRGDLESALTRWQQAMAIATRAGHARRIVELSAGMTELDLKMGHPELALQRIDRAMAWLGDGQFDGMKDELRIDQIVALLRLGRLDEGRRLLGPLLDDLDAKRKPVDRGDAVGELGSALAAAGDADAAMALYQREQEALHAGSDKRFEQSMLRRQAELGARQQQERRLEMRRWTVAAAVGGALLLVVSGFVPWLRARNRRLARANDDLRRQSERDPLTGLLNRDGLLRGLRERGRLDAFAGTLLLVDIDHFKSVNDTLGHAGGDAVLAEVARRLQASVRDGDYVARWGGEELVVAVLSTPFDADALVERILQSLAATPVTFRERSIAVSASIGYGAFPLEDPARMLSFDESLAIADAGMYYAKRHGRRAATRVIALAPGLLADLGGLPDALEREALAGGAMLSLRRAPGGPDPVSGSPAPPAAAGRPRVAST